MRSFRTTVNLGYNDVRIYRTIFYSPDGQIALKYGHFYRMEVSVPSDWMHPKFPVFSRRVQCNPTTVWDGWILKLLSGPDSCVKLQIITKCLLDTEVLRSSIYPLTLLFFRSLPLLNRLLELHVTIQDIGSHNRSVSDFKLMWPGMRSKFKTSNCYSALIIVNGFGISFVLDNI